MIINKLQSQKIMKLLAKNSQKSAQLSENVVDSEIPNCSENLSNTNCAMDDDDESDKDQQEPVENENVT